LRSGIISQEEVNLEGIALTGQQFREKIGPYKRVIDPITKEMRIDFEQ